MGCRHRFPVLRFRSAFCEFAAKGLGCGLGPAQALLQEPRFGFPFGDIDIHSPARSTACGTPGSLGFPVGVKTATERPVWRNTLPGLQ